MLKVFLIVLYLISASLGNHVLITQIKNDTEIPIRFSLVTASVGDKVSFHCKSTGNVTSKNSGVTWITAPSANFKFAQNDSSTIVLYPLKLNDVGTYTCASKNGKWSDNVELFVKSGRQWNINRQEEIQRQKEIQALLAQFHDPPSIDRFSYRNMEIFKPDPPRESKFLKADSKIIILKADSKIITTSTYTTFKQSVYIVPVTILLILSLVRFCYHLGNRSRIPWQQLNTANCDHQICAYRRRTNPAASCILSRTNSGRSVIIIQRVPEGATNLVAEEDAPPAYNEVNSDSPPTYTEAVETMSGAPPCAVTNSNAST